MTAVVCMTRVRVVGSSVAAITHPGVIRMGVVGTLVSVMGLRCHGGRRRGRCMLRMRVKGLFVRGLLVVSGWLWCVRRMIMVLVSVLVNWVSGFISRFRFSCAP